MLRALQYVFFPDANPATVVWSAHAGYFWRMLIVAYAGGMTLFTVLAIARRNPERVANALLPALSVAATLLAAQALFLP